jgi:preprotein translocase subunit SecD
VTLKDVERMAMIFDGVVRWCPVIREPLNEPDFKLSSAFTEEEANQIVEKLNKIISCK